MEQRRVYLRPSIPLNQAIEIVKNLYGLQLSTSDKLTTLPSYDDQNFHFKGKLSGDEEEREFILKVMNSQNSYNHSYLDAVDNVMVHINESQEGIECTVPIKSLSGSTRCQIELYIPDPVKTLSLLCRDADMKDPEQIKEAAKSDPLVRIKETEEGKTSYMMPHYVRLLTFVPGKPVSHLQSIPDELLVEAGAFVARVQRILKDFKHPELNSQPGPWHLENTCDLEYPYLASVSEPEKYGMIKSVIEEFKTINNLDKLPKQTIHGDINTANVLISNSSYKSVSSGEKYKSWISCHDKEMTPPFENGVDENKSCAAVIRERDFALTGLIDFGETSYNCAVFELAVCIAYFAVECYQKPLRTAALVFSGYNMFGSLTVEEEAVLPTLVKARLAQSLAIGYYQELQKPDNTFMSQTSKHGWDVLKTFLALDNEVLLSRFKEI